MPYTLTSDGSAGSNVELLEFSYDTNGITFELWLQTTTTAKQTLLLATCDGQPYPHIYIEDDKIGIYWNVEGGPVSVNSTNTDPISDGKWHHIAVVVSGPLVTHVQFYKDGREIDGGSSLALVTSPSEHSMQAGPAFSDAAAFTGQLTDIRLWNVARSSTEIAAFYQASLDPAVAGLVGYWPLSDGTATNEVYGGTATLDGSFTVVWTDDIAWTPLSELVVNIPSQAFPNFTGDQAKAYAAIVANLDLGGDLRKEYTNLAFPVSAVKSTIDSMPIPAGIGASDWNAVVEQLNDELTAVAATQAYFAQVNEYLTDLQSSNQDVLNQMIALAELEDDDSVSGSYMSLAASIADLLFADTVTSMVGAALSAIATLTTRTTSQSSDQAFTAEQAELWGVLQKNFAALLTQTGQSEKTLLCDWGRLSAMLRFVGDGTLVWSTMATADLVNASVNASSISYLQMLLPAKWRLYTLEPNSVVGLSSPSECNCLQNSVPDHAWTTVSGAVIVAAADDDLREFISAELHDELFTTLGISKSDFFGGQAGWTLPQRDYYCCNGPLPYGCNCGVQTG